ncbi:DUF498-domain-containing protein [Amylocystis lapponica]|nr:DUF498-domain-containing protein [Amylocystis lapponica]
MATSILRPLASAALRRSQHIKPRPRFFHATSLSRNSPSTLSNIFEGGAAPPVQVKTITSEGIELQDGLIIPSACIFLDGRVFLWHVPPTQWAGWGKEHLEIFDMVVPKPEILLFGTGTTVSLLPPALREYLSQTGIQVDVMDTRNACSTYNLLIEEGRHIAAALLPLSPRRWRDTPPK